VTTHGTLLAFAEGRSSRRDHAENDIVLKRSTNSGGAWGPLKVIHNDGSNALNNPTAVVLRDCGRILLMYQRFAQAFDERTAPPGINGPNICRVLIRHSDDDGLAWSEPRDITAQVKRPTGATSLASGPGIGIQLRRGKHSGRILLPFNQGPFGEWKVYAVFSDDGGKSWRFGEIAPEGSEGHANEVQFIELNDGSVMLNARNQGGNKHRKIAVSRDGGQTWPPTQTDPTLVEPMCQASLLRHPGDGDPKNDVFLFSNPASSFARTNGTVRFSRDNGRSWPVSRVLYEGSFGYSCLASMPEGSIACLFERDRTQRISLARFSVHWVEGLEP